MLLIIQWNETFEDNCWYSATTTFGMRIETSLVSHNLKQELVLFLIIGDHPLKLQHKGYIVLCSVHCHLWREKVVQNRNTMSVVISDQVWRPADRKSEPMCRLLWISPVFHVTQSSCTERTNWQPVLFVWNQVMEAGTCCMAASLPITILC